MTDFWKGRTPEGQGTDPLVFVEYKLRTGLSLGLFITWLTISRWLVTTVVG